MDEVHLALLTKKKKKKKRASDREIGLSSRCTVLQQTPASNIVSPQ